ncbi:zinc finger protein 425-like [Plodia interpunctella]|uniref:zinc finger protein 425-like n=1 Tax=Plodia interpunctella TaxID=58824 RepID=UPI0023680E3A|nr:zinc finger protein 425-like [Plodia interpunctella]
MENIAFMKKKLHNICQAASFCSICLESTENLWLLDTEFDITVNGRTQKKKLKDLVYYVFENWKEVVASVYICSYCTERSIQSYLFIYNARQLSKIMSCYVEDLSTKVDDVNIQFQEDNDYYNSNVVIVLDGKVDDINNYIDVCKTTEITAKESTNLLLHENERNKNYHYSKRLEKENVAVKLNTPENKLIKPYRKMRKFSKNVIYKCLKCKRILTTLNSWSEHEKICKNHRRITNIVLSLQCKICTEVMKTQRLLTLHYKFHEMERCKICHFIMPEGGLSDHLKLNHEDDIYVCEFCDHISYSKLASEVHKKKKHGDPQCIMCLKNFKVSELNSHKCKFRCLDCEQLPCIHHKYLVHYRQQVLSESKKIQCLDCEYVCSKREALIAHVNREHLDHHPFTCEHCSQQFYSKVTLKYHLNRFHRNNFVCEFCDLDFKVRAILEVHVEKCKLIKRQFKCDDCASSFDTPQELLSHRSTRHNEERFPCNLCNEKFFSNLKLKEHMFRIHSGIQTKRKRTNLECTICEIKFDDKKDFVQHIAEHGSVNGTRFPCRTCNKDFDDIKKLHAHTRMHGDDIIKCPNCKKPITEAFYPSHMIYCGANRDEDTNLSCGTCGKTFQSKSVLNNHKQIHLDCVTCQICGKLMKPIYLKRHLKYTHGQKGRIEKKCVKVIKCQWCGHMVTRKGELDAHVNRFHLKIKPYECDTCNKKFCGKERLKEHIQTHTSDHIRYCTVCGKKFANQVCLKMHLRLHSGVTPYSCDVCGEKFRSSSIMNTHKIKKHTEKSIACPLCDNMFYFAREMRHHFKKVHWKKKGQKFDPRDVKELGKEFYYLFEDRRIPKVNKDDVVFS